MSNHIYDRDAGSVTLNDKLRAKIVLCNLHGEELLVVDDVEVSPGDTLSWTYPEDGVRIEMA